jgi:hypothetical protein
MKSVAGKAFTMGVDKLLLDMSKHLTHTRRRREDLNGSLESVGQLPPKSGTKFNPRINFIIMQLFPDG